MNIDIEKIAKLANLNLTSEEALEFEKQLGDVVNYIEKLNKVDTTNIAETAQVTGLSNQLRDDTPSHESFSQDEALSGSTKIHNGLFVVEKTVDTTS